MSVAAVLLGKHQGLVLAWKNYQVGATTRGGNLLVCSFHDSACYNSALCSCKMGQNANVYVE